MEVFTPNQPPWGAEIPHDARDFLFVEKYGTKPGQCQFRAARSSGRTIQVHDQMSVPGRPIEVNGSTRWLSSPKLLLTQVCPFPVAGTRASHASEIAY